MWFIIGMIGLFLLALLFLLVVIYAINKTALYRGPSDAEFFDDYDEYLEYEKNTLEEAKNEPDTIC